MKLEKILEKAFAECERAERLHPVWPKSLIHGGMLVAEEQGEMNRAILDHDEKKGSKQNIITVAIHTLAVTIRFLKNIEEDSINNETHL